MALNMMRMRMEHDIKWRKDLVNKCREYVGISDLLKDRFEIRIGGGGWTGEPITIHITDIITNKKIILGNEDGYDYIFAKNEIIRILRKEKIEKLLNTK